MGAPMDITKIRLFLAIFVGATAFGAATANAVELQSGDILVIRGANNSGELVRVDRDTGGR